MNAVDVERGEYVDQLVFRFQAGDKEAIEEVLADFGGHPKDPVNLYVGKYYNMLRYSRFSFKDSDSRTFISCYLNDEQSKAVRKKYPRKEVRDAALSALTRLVDQCKIFSDEDLIQDLRMIFIQQATYYVHKYKDVYFPGYLYNSYGFAVRNHLERVFKAYDPFTHMYTDKQMVSMQEDLHIDDSTCIQLDERKFTSLPMMIDDDELGNSWVRGLTCGDEFVKLTQLQRLIIKLYYQDDLNDRLIAEKINMHINTIHKQRKRAVQIIQETMEELFKGGYEL